MQMTQNSAKFLGGLSMQYLIGIILLVLVVSFLLQHWWIILGAVLAWLLYKYVAKRSKKNKSTGTSEPVSDPKSSHTDEVVNLNLETKTNAMLPESNAEKVNEEDVEQESTTTKHVIIEPMVTANFETPKVHKLRRKLFDFVVFDIETTGFRKNEDNIIQLSALKVRNDEIVDQFDSYVNPHMSLPTNISYLTGITDNDVNSAPDITIVINQFKSFIADLPLVGHNIYSFDIPFMQAKGFDLTDISALDTYVLADSKAFTITPKNLKLPTLKKYYGIVNRSHNALNDCKTNYQIYKFLRDDQLDPISVDVSNITQNLAGLRFAISGEFIKTSKDQIKEEIELHGGKVTSGVSGLTDYLIDGKQISSKLTDGEHSKKELDALEKQQSGGKIQIISLEEFEKKFMKQQIA